MKYIQLILFILFLTLYFVYYNYSFGGENTDKIFISITTFFFSIFTGFFISRQGSRYTRIREIISKFDGEMSAIYRASGNLSLSFQEKVGEIVKNHYSKIIETQSWDYHFTRKSNTLKSIHNLLEEEVGGNKVESLRNQSIGKIMGNLGDCQVLRKNMVMTYQERIPSFQWFLIIFFVLILLSAVTVIPSVGFLLGSILKSAFAVSILSVVVILYNLDNLHLFEKFIGENSANDVIDIIEGNK